MIVPHTSNNPERKRTAKPTIRLARCPTCGRPCIRHRGRDHCLHCGDLPLIDRAERREVAR